MKLLRIASYPFYAATVWFWVEIIKKESGTSPEQAYPYCNVDKEDREDICFNFKGSNVPQPLEKSEKASS